MESKAKFLGHPIHQMLIVFPLGLLPVAVLADIVAMVTGNNFWYQMAFYMIAAGIVGGLAAAVFGLIDFLAIPSGTRARRIGLLHGGGNVIVTGLFALSWYLRYLSPDYVPGNFAVTLSLLAIALALVTAWLGGELVDRLGVGVDPGANLDAPSSLTNEPINNTVVTDARFSQTRGAR
jgi:Predicted membrane protein